MSPEPRRPPGRPYDHARDAEILALTLNALAERDYKHVTLDDLARRAGRAKTTLYRRWPSKIDLVLAAVRAAGRPPELDAVPDEGSLRADLVAVVHSDWLGGPVRRMSIFAGLTTAAGSSSALADLVRTEITEPYAALYEALLHRAVERGLVSPVAGRIALVAQVIPAMSDLRLGGGEQSLGPDFFVSVVDDVVLPALTSGA